MQFNNPVELEQHEGVVSNMHHWYPTSVGNVDDDNYKKGIEQDLSRGFTVKVHNHRFDSTNQEQSYRDADLCDCPIRRPDDAASNQQEGKGQTQ